MEALKSYLKELRTIPLLTQKEEIELAKRIKKGDEQARKAMIRANLRLVINIAKRYIHLGIPLLDLIEEGNLGLMKAVEKFNHRKGFRFSTYAAWWIKQSITRSISEQGKVIRVPVYMNELIAKWKKTKEQMFQAKRQPPTDEEIAKKMRLTKDKSDHITFWLKTTTASLETPVGEEENNTIMDLVESTTATQPDAEIERFLDRERLDNLMELMTERERKILDMRFGLEDGKTYTLAEVSKKVGISRERVRQIEEEAIEKIRGFISQQEKEK
jgi:RNA polymerase primary sigma factor